MSSQDSGGMWLFGKPRSDHQSREPEGQSAEPAAGPPAEGSRPDARALPPVVKPPVVPSPAAEPRVVQSPVAEPPAAKAVQAPPDGEQDESGFQTAVREPADPSRLRRTAAPDEAPDRVEPGPGSWAALPTEAPLSTDRRGLAPIAIVGLLVVVVALGGGVAWFALRDDLVTPGVAPAATSVAVPTSSGGTDAPYESPSEAATFDTDPSAEPTSAETSSETSPDDGPTEKEAHEQLNALADEGLNDVSLDGQDVAMIASKWDGVVDPLQKTTKGRHRFHYVDILAEHNRLAAEDNLGAQVVLLRGTDYGRRATSPDGKEIYVTLALGDFGSLREVRAWCNDRFADLSRKKRDNQCAATKLTE